MASISAWENRTVTVDITVDDLPIKLKVRPNASTPERELLIFEAEGSDAADAVLSFFVAYVADWDITEADEVTPVPITVERLRNFPSSLLKGILRLSAEKVAKQGN